MGLSKITQVLFLPPISEVTIILFNILNSRIGSKGLKLISFMSVFVRLMVVPYNVRGRFFKIPLISNKTVCNSLYGNM